MRQLILLLIISSSVGCEKQLATDVDANFIGDWGHSSNGSYHHIEIDADGKGYNTGGNGWPLMTGDQRRKWFIRGSTLEFGNFTPDEEKFHIDSFPKVCLTADTIGDNFLSVDKKYLWLDGRVYVAYY